MALFKFKNQDPRDNVTIEKTLIEQGENFLLFSTLQQSAFIGIDVGVEALKLDDPDTKFVRYMGTGGPVFFDAGNVKVGVLIDYVDGCVMNYIIKWAKWVIKSLQDLGINAIYENGSNDIFLNGKKICGVGARVFKKKIYLAFFFTLNLDFEKARKAIVVTKHTTNLADRATSIKAETNKEVDPDLILQSLIDNIGGYFDNVSIEENENKLDKHLVDKNKAIFFSNTWLKHGRHISN